jgi:asparagine synthase (glutamine-hydrolysing)
MEHWRSNPGLLDPVRPLGIFREAWIDQILAGDVHPDWSVVTLLTNLRVAAESGLRKFTEPRAVCGS